MGHSQADSAHLAALAFEHWATPRLTHLPLRLRHSRERMPLPMFHSREVTLAEVATLTAALLART